MATNTKLKPFRAYSEYEVFNGFSFSGTHPATAGTVVKGVASGWRADESNVSLFGNVGAGYGNTVSQRYGGVPSVTSAGTGDTTLGILIYDVRETDENGEKLIYNPRKALENNWVVSGLQSPILTRGWVLISGAFNGTAPTAGTVAYPSGNGEITTNTLNQVPASIVGKFYGGVDSQGYALLHVAVA